MKRGAVLMLGGLVLAIAGCGSEKAASTGVSTTGGSSTGPQRVTMKEIEFHPKDLKASVNRPVTFQNREDVAHNVVAQEGAKFKSKTLQAGASFTYTPKKAGTIEYVCTLHPGMEGTLDVEE